MNDDQYLEHCRELLTSFSVFLAQQSSQLPDSDPLRELASGFEQIAQGAADSYIETPGLISRLFTTYPEIAPALPRQLLWFFGGDCLHFMPDEEIAQYQQLEELRLEAAARGETLDLKDARAKLLKSQ